MIGGVFCLYSCYRYRDTLEVIFRGGFEKLFYQVYVLFQTLVTYAAPYLMVNRNWTLVKASIRILRTLSIFYPDYLQEVLKSSL